MAPRTLASRRISLASILDDPSSSVRGGSMESSGATMAVLSSIMGLISELEATLPLFRLLLLRRSQEGARRSISRDRGEKEGR